MTLLYTSAIMKIFSLYVNAPQESSEEITTHQVKLPDQLMF